MNIMLVDDDDIIRQGMKKIILNSEHDWNVVAEAADGENALQLLKEHPETELLITDVKMPIMDGIELIKKIREKDTGLKIIVLSGFDDYSYVHGAFINGALDYLLKPFQKSELLAKIESIENSIVAEQEINQYDKERKPVLLADTINRLLKGSGENITRDIRELENLGINASFSNFFVCIIRADQYYRQFKGVEEYVNRLNEDVKKIISECTERKEYDYCYYVNNQEMVCLFFCNNQEVAKELELKLFNTLNNREELVTDTIGFSNIHNSVEEMRVAYQEAFDAVQARFYMGKNIRIYYDEIADKYIDFQYDLEPMARQIIHCLELNDIIEAKSAIEQLFLDLSYSRPDKFRKYVVQFIEILIIRMREFDKVLQMQFQDWQFQIEYINTYRELKSFMNSIMQEVIEFIKEEKSKKSKKRIELAKIYIEENYKKQITLNDVAEHVELNASYFSNLFKEEEGINFSEYLLNIRMENAKRLLKDPTIKVYEIGNLVGYEDAVSFGRAFKKKIGMSPKEYRNFVY